MDAAESYKLYPEKREMELVHETWDTVTGFTNKNVTRTADQERLLQFHGAGQQQASEVDSEVREIHIKEEEKVFTLIYKMRIKAGEEVWHLPRMWRKNMLL